MSVIFIVPLAEDERKKNSFQEVHNGAAGTRGPTRPLTRHRSLCLDRKRALSLTRRLRQVTGPFQLSRSQRVMYWGGKDREALRAVSRPCAIDGLNNITLNGGNTQADFDCAPPLCHSHLIRLAAPPPLAQPAAEARLKIPKLRSAIFLPSAQWNRTGVGVDSPNRGRSYICQDAQKCDSISAAGTIKEG